MWTFVAAIGGRFTAFVPYDALASFVRYGAYSIYYCFCGCCLFWHHQESKFAIGRAHKITYRAFKISFKRLFLVCYTDGTRCYLLGMSQFHLLRCWTISKLIQSMVWELLPLQGSSVVLPICHLSQPARKLSVLIEIVSFVTNDRWQKKRLPQPTSNAETAVLLLVTRPTDLDAFEGRNTKATLHVHLTGINRLLFVPPDIESTVLGIGGETLVYLCESLSFVSALM